MHPKVKLSFEISSWPAEWWEAAVAENPLALQYASDRWRCDKAGLDAGDSDK